MNIFLVLCLPPVEAWKGPPQMIGSCWSWSSNALATWCEEPTHWKRPWCLERLKVRGEGSDRGWGGWMVSLTQWTWVWVNSESCSSWYHSQTWLSDWTTTNIPLQVLNHTNFWPLTLFERSSGWRSEMRHPVLWKTGRTDLQIDIFRSWFYDPNSRFSSYLENPNPFMVISSLWLAENLDCIELPFTKIL